MLPIVRPSNRRRTPSLPRTVMLFPVDAYEPEAPPTSTVGLTTAAATVVAACAAPVPLARSRAASAETTDRSEEHTSELQSRPHLVCRLLLEKKKKTGNTHTSDTEQNLRTDE